MEQNFTQQPAANEPIASSDNAAATSNNVPTDLDNNLLAWVKQYLKPYEVLTNALHNVRISSEFNMAPNIPSWPKQHVFCSTDAILTIYNMLSERGAFGAEHSAELERLVKSGASEEVILEKMLYTPSLICSLLPWEKERCIFHVKKQELPAELLDTKTSLAARLPQWGMCFNLENEDMSWDNRRMIGIIFSRYFISKPPQNQLSPEALQEMVKPSVEGEEPSIINNLVSTVVFEDGSFDLGPFVPLDDNITFNQFLNQLETDITKNLDPNTTSPEEIAKTKQMAQDTTARSRVLFKYLVYALQHMDQVKDKHGEAATIPPHPQIIVTKDNPKIISAEIVRQFYID